jgi:hypothetical protein
MIIKLSKYKEFKIYNNNNVPHFVHFPLFWIGKIYRSKYAIKIGNLVIEYDNYKTKRG